MFVVAALTVLAVVLLCVAERARRRAAGNRRRREAEQRLRAAMQRTDKRLALENAKREQAAALTRVVPAIRTHETRHIA